MIIISKSKEEKGKQEKNRKKEKKKKNVNRCSSFLHEFHV